ncbi:MAG: aminopeptidase P family protein [Desulfobacter sp.]|nr:MAG: aminopeptidase P family protein [Desulfobacter sp.]
MNTAEKLAALRAAMEQNGAEAVVIPSSDPHQSEYTADHWHARHWLTGFTGSAGIAVVTRSTAGLWTDFRYWIQAKSQMDEFQLFRQGEPEVPEFQVWLADNLDRGSRIAMDGKLLSLAQFRKYKALFEDKGIELDTSLDLVSEIWEDRPPMPGAQAFVLDPAYAGRTRTEKLDEIRKKMAGYGTGFHLMTALDDIAWTFNLRGEDAHTNPVALAFALVSIEQTQLFIHPDKLSAGVRDELEGEGISLEPYQGIDHALAGLEAGGRLLVDPEIVSDYLCRQVNPGVQIIEKKNPATELKCIKNKVETGHIRETAVKDGRAMVNFLHWLAHAPGPLTERSVAEKLLGFRREQKDFIKASFDSIMAFSDHSAMCHYSATDETDAALTKDGMFLTDSGGNYLTGTTDITRTLHLGRPNEKQMRDYTLVLKGHIAVATARFPAGTRGYQIDTLSRQYLWQQGLDFGHGTGHGVGFFLCVHEGPARISPFPVDVALKPGMLLTNEPGLYREGEYGIRLENMVMVAQAEKNNFGQFLTFENMTLCHFERELMARSLLTADEIQWINDYHHEVYEKLAPGLTPEVQDWLKKKTLPL